MARGSAGVMQVELLYFEGCLGQERLLPAVRRPAAEAGAEVALSRIETPAAAETERFLGSPTVRANDRDVDRGAAGRADFGLSAAAMTSAPSPELGQGDGHEAVDCGLGRQTAGSGERVQAVARELLG